MFTKVFHRRRIEENLSDQSSKAWIEVLNGGGEIHPHFFCEIANELKNWAQSQGANEFLYWSSDVEISGKLHDISSLTAVSLQHVEDQSHLFDFDPHFFPFIKKYQDKQVLYLPVFFKGEKKVDLRNCIHTSIEILQKSLIRHFSRFQDENANIVPMIELSKWLYFFQPELHEQNQQKHFDHKNFSQDSIQDILESLCTKYIAYSHCLGLQINLEKTTKSHVFCIHHQKHPISQSVYWNFLADELLEDLLKEQVFSQYSSRILGNDATLSFKISFGTCEKDFFKKVQLKPGSNQFFASVLELLINRYIPVFKKLAGSGLKIEYLLHEKNNKFSHVLDPNLQSFPFCIVFSNVCSSFDLNLLLNVFLLAFAKCSDELELHAKNGTEKKLLENSLSSENEKQEGSILNDQKLHFILSEILTEDEIINLLYAFLDKKSFFKKDQLSYWIDFFEKNILSNSVLYLDSSSFKSLSNLHIELKKLKSELEGLGAEAVNVVFEEIIDDKLVEFIERLKTVSSD